MTCFTSLITKLLLARCLAAISLLAIYDCVYRNVCLCVAFVCSIYTYIIYIYIYKYIYSLYLHVATFYFNQIIKNCIIYLHYLYTTFKIRVNWAKNYSSFRASFYKYVLTSRVTSIYNRRNMLENFRKFLTRLTSILRCCSLS